MVEDKPMARVALPFPALPGKTEEDLRGIARHFEANPAEYAESRKRSGITLERAYLQQTPMGMFVVAYQETTGSVADTMAALAQSTLAIDRFFVEAVQELHGIDLTQPMPGPEPEVVGQWSDPAVTERRRGMAFCAPMIPGTEDRGRAWARDTFSSDGMTASRRALGGCLEVVTLLQTPDGPVCAIYVEGNDPFEANRRFAESTDPFDAAFKEELTHLFPPFIDFGKPVPGITEIFDSQTVLARR
jgi:hypothetical protein